MQLKFLQNVYSLVKMLKYYAFHILQRPFLWLEDSLYLQNVFNLQTLIEMMTEDSYPVQAKSDFVKLLTQSMRSEHFLIFYRPAFLSMKIPLIFLLNCVPLW